MKHLCYINGEIKPEGEIMLHVSDLSITRGFGVFDFMRAAEGVPLFLEEYLDRFYNSAAELDLNVPESKEDLKGIVYDLVNKNGGGDLGIKFMLTGGYSKDNYTPSNPNLIIMISTIKFLDTSVYDEGVRLMTYNYQRDIAEIKSLNYLTPIYLRKQLKEYNADDVLYYTKETVTESARSNFFMIKEEKVITSETGILNGITRINALKVAAQKYPVEVRDIPVEELLEADEAFVTSTTKRILPVCKIDGRHLGYVPGPITKDLMDMFLEFERKEIDKFKSR